MEPDENGFLYPQIDEARCVGCGLCERVCAYQHGPKRASDKETYAAAAQDADLVRSASGGVFASLAQAVLAQGGVVYGCAMEREDGRLVVRHVAVTALQELPRLKGSKYVQSEIGTIYRDVQEQLNAGKTVLFSGTPCQAAGLRGFLRKAYDNLFVVDIVCHGVPSLQFFRDYLRLTEEKYGGRIVDFRFRDKSAGWKLHGCMSIETADGHAKSVCFEPEESSYYQMFLNSYTYRENCYSCPYAGENRPGDVTIGDYWCIDLVHPEVLAQQGGKFDEQRGVSCLIVNNARGRELLARFGQGIAREPSTYEQAARYNAQLTRPSAMKEERAQVLALYRDGGYAQVEKWYQKRLRKIRFVRGLRAAVPRWAKERIKSLLKRVK
ncbi:MAG: Coenzyme F420 hydrogenase/dehydrogenase, beta subunit C-terminal domain [Clostridiales bacterium]|nr:Coenzyme F420 hydrogenase/dehydrogenase, beta subunit C-terminal domain [Clostridiales bacterium]